MGFFLGGGDRTGFWRPVFNFKKKLGELSHFFFSSFSKEREKGMTNTQSCPSACEEVLDVESKWSYLPITPTYDEYVQRWVVMSEREGFHVKTRSSMKELLEDAKRIVLTDKSKKRMLFKVACILSCLSGVNFTWMTYCWYLIGTTDFVSSIMSTHFCWGKHLTPCGKTWSILSHVSGLIWSRNQWSTRES
jgi:hypothetical protein